MGIQNNHKKGYKWTKEQFEEKIEEINPNIIVSNFTKTTERVQCKCKKCGYEWNPIAGSVLNGRGCPKCAKKIPLDFNEFKKEFNKNNNLNIDIISENAKKTTDKIKCRCKICGNIWMTDVNHLKHEHGCNSCKHTGTSFVEQSILKAFKIRLGDDKVLSRNKSFIGKELDIFIPTKNIAFEPGCWDFHKNKIDQDNQKRDLCKEKGIRLITIYDKYDDSLIPIHNDCITYEFMLGEYNKRKELRKLINNLFTISGISPELSDEEWEDIQQYANIFSMRKSPQAIKNEMELINPFIRVLETPTRSNEKVLCRCMKCNYEWLTTPSYIKSGSGCPNCNLTKKITQKEFEEQLNKVNPDIIAMEPYKNITTPIEFKCKKCKCIWKTIPRNIIRNNNAKDNCPKCRKIKMLINVLDNNKINVTKSDINIINELADYNYSTKYNTNEITWLMSKINPDIEILEEYIGIDHKIKCRCKKCDTVWNPKPHHLLNGHGCPTCNTIENFKSVKKICVKEEIK